MAAYQASVRMFILPLPSVAEHRAQPIDGMRLSLNKESC